MPATEGQRTDSQYLVHRRAFWYKTNRPAFFARLKHLTEDFFKKATACVVVPDHCELTEDSQC